MTKRRSPPAPRFCTRATLTRRPPEAEFTNFTAAGQGQAFDPLSFSTSVQYWSDSTTDLRYRDDYQLMTANVLSGGTGAINYISGTLAAFGNNNETPSGGNVNNANNTAFSYMTNPTGAQVLSALTTASDHLPNVADYTFTPVPEPGCLSLLAAGSAVILLLARHAPAKARRRIGTSSFVMPSMAVKARCATAASELLSLSMS